MSNNLKKHYLPLYERNTNGEWELKPVFTPDFIPFKTVITATKMAAKMQKDTTGEKEIEMLEEMMSFVANEIYQGKITTQDLVDKLYAPDAIETLKEQIAFVSQGYQTKEAKEFVKNFRP